MIQARHQIKTGQETFDLLKHQLQAKMQQAERATFKIGSVTWKKSKDSISLDSKALLKKHPEYLNQFPQRKQGSCCGCGEQVVTPFSPTDWKMIFDGETVSLTPSVGNWNLACRSHYIIKQNTVIEAGNWSQSQIKAERKRDQLAKTAYYQSKVENDSVIHNSEKATSIVIKKSSWGKRLLDLILGWTRFLK